MAHIQTRLSNRRQTEMKSFVIILFVGEWIEWKLTMILFFPVWIFLRILFFQINEILKFEKCSKFSLRFLYCGSCNVVLPFMFYSAVIEKNANFWLDLYDWVILFFFYNFATIIRSFILKVKVCWFISWILHLLRTLQMTIRNVNVN